ncbi:hypothetical protein AC578_3228 [Pseudocercospora eumusae]|uniref:Uncharacterized protein n=1 Tax=Pseudocercospora eumusae TaxID=321146 RepID=A0A139H1T7_9PEZI|nr:hypothetical protein AC578_3228 [Pseudocercospora eumusae]
MPDRAVSPGKCVLASDSANGSSESFVYVLLPTPSNSTSSALTVPGDDDIDIDTTTTYTMKFLSSLAFMAALAAADDFNLDMFHSDMAKRATVTIDTIIADIKNITNQTLQLNQALQNLSEPIQALAVNTAGTAVQAAINQSIADAMALPEVPATAIGIIAPIQALGNASNITIASLIFQKPFFVQYGFQNLTLQSMQLQNLTSTQFNAILLEKTSPLVRDNSKALGAPALRALAIGIAAYSNNGTGVPLETVLHTSAASGLALGWSALAAVALAVAAVL